MFFFGKSFSDPDGTRHKLNPIDFQILSLLQEQEKDGMTGYKIIETLKVRFRGIWTPSTGTIFPVLQRLEEAGFINDTSPGPRDAVIHHITEKGQAALQGQIANDIEIKVFGDVVRRILGHGPYPHRYLRIAKFLDELLKEVEIKETGEHPDEEISDDIVKKYAEIYNRISKRIQQFDPSTICHCGHFPFKPPSPPPGFPPEKLPPIKPPPIPRERPPKEVKGVPIKVEGDDE